MKMMLIKGRKEREKRREKSRKRKKEGRKEERKAEREREEERKKEKNIGLAKSLFEFSFTSYGKTKGVANPILLNDIMCCRERGWGISLQKSGDLKSVLLL